MRIQISSMRHLLEEPLRTYLLLLFSHHLRYFRQVNSHGDKAVPILARPYKLLMLGPGDFQVGSTCIRHGACAWTTRTARVTITVGKAARIELLLITPHPNWCGVKQFFWLSSRR